MHWIDFTVLYSVRLFFTFLTSRPMRRTAVVEAEETKESFMTILKSTLAVLIDKRMLLFMPISLYSGTCC
jgi:hypothetical protein